MAVEFPVGEHWFCVRTKPKKERMAAANVASMYGLDVFCPQIRFRRKTARGPVWFQEAMFPGYIFVRFEMMEMKQAIAYAPGVMNIPMFNERYIAVPSSVIESIQNDLNEEETVDAGIELNVGDETTIMEGPMRGLKVKVIKVMDANDRVGVLLEMLGTLVEAEISNSALEQRTTHRLATE